MTSFNLDFFSCLAESNQEADEGVCFVGLIYRLECAASGSQNTKLP